MLCTFLQPRRLLALEVDFDFLDSAIRDGFITNIETPLWAVIVSWVRTEGCTCWHWTSTPLSSDIHLKDGDSSSLKYNYPVNFEFFSAVCLWLLWISYFWAVNVWFQKNEICTIPYPWCRAFYKMAKVFPECRTTRIVCEVVIEIRECAHTAKMAEMRICNRTPNTTHNF